MNKNSKTIIAGLILLAIIIWIGMHFKQPYNTLSDTKDTSATAAPIVITEKKIKEQNYIGTKAVISGGAPIAGLARTYIDQTVATFADTADADVPSMRETYGADSPTSQYSIDIKAKYVEGSETESIVVSEYLYTGGAHGSSIYQVFTGSRKDGGIIALSDVIKDDQQEAFVAFIKQRLLVWKPDGMEETAVFADTVGDLTFDSLSNWSIDDKNFTIYFDQYAIGPGVLGAVAFPIKLSEMKPYLKTL
jgi:hypothetical protein